MANELVINHPTGSTLYALLFNGTGQIYNGATFGAPDSASWTDYDIAMTEATTATGIYRADMPAVAAGVYGWVVRKQAGANPAVSDITVGAGSIRWTGTAEETVPAAVNVTYSAGVALAGRLAEYADVSPLALEATAQAILEDTGTALPALIAGIEGGGDPWATALPGAYGAGTAGALLSGIDSNVDMLLAADTSSSDATTAGAISRRRGDSWSIPLTIGAITGYTSLWFTIKSSYDDVDTAALLQIKLNSPSALDGLLYVNGTTASSAALGSITVSDAATGEIVVNVDETITDDLAPGTYYYDVQTLISGNVATPDSGVFTVTADVTRSVT